MLDGIFFINHALKVNQLSVYSEEERFEQTIETIKSIDERCYNNIKFMFDSSPSEPTEDYVKRLIDMGLNILYMGDIPEVRHFSNLGLRSISETISFMNFIDWFKQQNIVGKRIYKLSGRYKLNDNFIYDHDTYKSSFVFSNSLDSWMDKSVGVNKLYRLRLWHMDYDLIDSFRFELPNILNDCISLNIDVEHSYYKNLNKYNIVELEKIGVCGNIAPNGVYIDE